MYSAYAAAMPQLDPVNQHIWYTDHDRGFYVVKPTNGTWITDITEETVSVEHGQGFAAYDREVDLPLAGEHGAGGDTGQRRVDAGGDGSGAVGRSR